MQTTSFPFSNLMTAFSFNLRFLLIKQQYIRYINHSNLYHFLFSSIHIPHQMTLNASTLMSLSTFLDYFLFLWAYFLKRWMGKAILKHAWAGTKLFEGVIALIHNTLYTVVLNFGCDVWCFDAFYKIIKYAAEPNRA